MGTNLRGRWRESCCTLILKVCPVQCAICSRVPRLGRGGVHLLACLRRTSESWKCEWFGNGFYRRGILFFFYESIPTRHRLVPVACDKGAFSVGLISFEPVSETGLVFLSHESSAFNSHSSIGAASDLPHCMLKVFLCFFLSSCAGIIVHLHFWVSYPLSCFPVVFDFRGVSGF